MEEDWLDSSEARAALALVGGPLAALANPSLFLELMGNLRDAGTDKALEQWAQERHTNVRRLIDLMADVAIEQPTEDLRIDRDRDALGGRNLAGATKRGAVELFLHDVDPDVIGRIFDVPPERIRSYIYGRRALPEREREVVRRHFAGEQVTHIAKALEISREAVYQILRRAGESPVQGLAPAGSADRSEIVRLRNEGASYAEIREATGASTNQIRNALKARKHQVKGYAAHLVEEAS